MTTEQIETLREILNFHFMPSPSDKRPADKHNRFANALRAAIAELERLKAALDVIGDVSFESWTVEIATRAVAGEAMDGPTVEGILNSHKR